MLKLDRDSFTSLRALVVGDVMLDRYWFGRVDRISPEAPVPVLAVHKEESRAGGAANVAHNLVALGAQCQLLSVVGDDEPGREIETIVAGDGVQATLRVDPSLKTIVKVRMVAQNQQLLRADFDQCPGDEVLAQCLDDYQAAIENSDVVLLSDYGKGGLKHVETLIGLARQAGVPVIVDPKGSDYSRYKGASLITPNMKEFEAVAGAVANDHEFRQRAHELREALELDSLLVTRSEKGMSLFTSDGSHTDSPARALEVYDVSGAGDTVIAMMALVSALGRGHLSNEKGFNDSERLELANTVAGIVVGKVGTAVATIDEVIAKLAENEELGR